ncbi:MAG: glycogen/starch synthase [Candidatus Micrarchaeia archaeon]
MVDAVIEVSSEAGRQIGGIYTVLQSKSASLVKRFGDDYLLVGFCDDKCEGDFKEEIPSDSMEKVFRSLEEQGITCKVGRWIYGSNARLILVNASKFAKKPVSYYDGYEKHDTNSNYVKFLLWKNFGVDSLMSREWDFTENVAWAYACGMLIEKLLAMPEYSGKKAVAQFHEWISGAGLLYCRMHDLPCGTVFTTHATVLGRSMASSGYDVLSLSADPQARVNVSNAYRFGVEAKHLLEAAAAINADVFTTVSQTVAQEVRYFLGRYPDVITTNGLDLSDASAPSLAAPVSKYVRAELIQFCESYFIPYYAQNYKNPLLVYTSGRYEFTNKGFDLFIAALGLLNKKLKRLSPAPERRVFAFIFAPSATIGPRQSVIRNYLTLDKIHEFLSTLPKGSVGAMDENYSNLQAATSSLVGKTKADIVSMMRSFDREGSMPLINAYDLAYSNDKIVNSCIEGGLTNSQDDVVKVIFYPTYVKPYDGLLDLPYYDVISGMDVGVFLSRYEPFGYTPAESALHGSISVTSDTTGIGRFLKTKLDVKDKGISVLDMAGKGDSTVAQELTDFLESLYMMPPSRLAAMKTEAFSMARALDWNELIANYFEAYEKAARARDARKPAQASP